MKTTTEMLLTRLFKLQRLKIYKILVDDSLPNNCERIYLVEMIDSGPNSYASEKMTRRYLNGSKLCDLFGWPDNELTWEALHKQSAEWFGTTSTQFRVVPTCFFEC